MTQKYSIYKIEHYAVFVFILLLFTRGFPNLEFLYVIVYPLLLIICIKFLQKSLRERADNMKLFYDENKNKFMEFKKTKTRININRIKKSSSRIISLVKNKVLNVNKIIFIFFLAFGIWAILTSFWSPHFFMSISRALFFIILFLGCYASGIKLKGLEQYQIGLFFMIINIAITITGLFSFYTNIPNLPLSGNNYFGFMGFTNHPNKLGQYIFITFSLSAISFLKIKNYYYKNKILTIFFYSFLTTINLFLLFKSNSRASLFSLVMFLSIFLFLYFDLKKYSMFAVGFIILISSLLTISETTREAISDFVYKNNSSNILASREALINASYSAALEGGLFGKGYGVSSENIKLPDIGMTNNGNYYQREKTVSILAIIEETGLVGLIIFISGILLTLFSMIRFMYKSNNPDIKIIFAVLVSFLISLNVYGQIESWWIAIGSLPFAIFFIVIGYGISLQTNEPEKIKGTEFKYYVVHK